MAGDGVDVWRSKDGRAWRIGRDAEVAWIEENTPSGLRITFAIPPVFEAYATLELPGTGNHAPGSSLEKWEQLDKEWEHHEAGVLAVLSGHSGPQPWWLGYLETGASDLIFDGARRVRFYADWNPVRRDEDVSCGAASCAFSSWPVLEVRT